MSNDPCKWMLGLALLGMATDTLVSRPVAESRDEYQYKSLIPEHRIHGFASERQWLFAHRKFRNQCALEAMGGRAEQHHPSLTTAARRGVQAGCTRLAKVLRNFSTFGATTIAQ